MSFLAATFHLFNVGKTFNPDNRKQSKKTIESRRILSMKELITQIQLLLTFFTLIERTSKIDNWLTRKTNTYELGDISSISNEYFSRTLPLGAYVSGQAFFSEFAHTFIPACYSPQRPGAAAEKINSFRSVKNKIEFNASIDLKPTIFPLPLQSLPSVLAPSGNYKIGFLYPESFLGFIYEIDPERQKKSA